MTPPNTTPYPDMMSAEELSDAIHERIDIKHCCDGFHYPWDEARGIIEQRDAAIRAQAIDETLERCAVISEKTSLMGPGAVISEAIRALKTGG